MSTVGSDQSPREPSAAQQAQIRQAAASSGYNAGLATQIIQNPAAAQSVITELDRPQNQAQPMQTSTTETVVTRTVPDIVPGLGRGQYLGNAAAESNAAVAYDRGFNNAPALATAEFGLGRSGLLGKLYTPPPPPIPNVIPGQARGDYLAYYTGQSIQESNASAIALNAYELPPGLFQTGKPPPPPGLPAGLFQTNAGGITGPPPSEFNSATSIGLKTNAPFPTLIGTQTGQSFAKGTAAPFVGAFTGQPDLAGGLLEYFTSGGKNGQELTAFKNQGLAYDIGDILGNALFAYSISQVAGLSGKAAESIGIPATIARATASPLVFGGVSAAITAARGGSAEQIGESFAVSAGVGAGLEITGFGISKLVAYYAPRAEIAEEVAPTIGKAGSEVSVFETSPIENLQGRTVRVVADVTEQPAKTEDLIAEYSGQNVPTAHATLSPEFFNLKPGEETVLESAGGAKGFRQAEQIFPFYSAPGSEESLTIYGGYSGIGESGSEVGRVVTSGKPTALVTESTFVSPIDRLEGESTGAFETRYLSRSGETSVGLENLLGKSSERQLETTTAYERFGKQLPGSKFVSLGKAATIQVRQTPELATSKLGIDLEADTPVIASFERIFRTRYTKIDIFKGRFEPTTEADIGNARPLNLRSYSNALRESEGATFSKPVASVEFLYSLGPESVPSSNRSSLRTSSGSSLVRSNPSLPASSRSSLESNESPPGGNSLSDYTINSRDNFSTSGSSGSSFPYKAPSFSLSSLETVSTPASGGGSKHVDFFGTSPSNKGAPVVFGNLMKFKSPRFKKGRGYKEFPNIFYTRQLLNFKLPQKGKRGKLFG